MTGAVAHRCASNQTCTFALDSAVSRAGSIDARAATVTARPDNSYVIGVPAITTEVIIRRSAAKSGSRLVDTYTPRYVRTIVGVVDSSTGYALSRTLGADGRRATIGTALESGQRIGAVPVDYNIALIPAVVSGCAAKLRI